MELRDLRFLLSLTPLLACVVDVEDTEDSGFGDAGDASDSSGGDGAPVCGNGVIEAGEACDSDNFGEVTCASLALGTGQLACSAQCEIVAAACEGFMGTSGDGAASVSASGASASATASDTAPAEDDGYSEGYAEDSYGTFGDDYGDDGTGTYNPACVQYGQAASNCYGGDPNEYAYYCQYSFEAYAGYGPACASALEDYYVCLSGTACGQFGVGCDAELLALDSAC